MTLLYYGGPGMEPTRIRATGERLPRMVRNET
ncbi:MAG: hypothetical protein QOH92_194 [Chloroflexota bacterium]|jgi:hypothetical protein|nr:hypothetical protein [Chloroflexota bacterium]